MTQMNLSMKYKQNQGQREQTCSCQGVGGGMAQEVKLANVSDYKERINKILLYSPRNYSEYLTVTHKIRLVKAMVFPVVMYGLESWTIKKAEHQRTDAFELWC